MVGAVALQSEAWEAVDDLLCSAEPLAVPKCVLCLQPSARRHEVEGRRWWEHASPHKARPPLLPRSTNSTSNVWL